MIRVRGLVNYGDDGPDDAITTKSKVGTIMIWNRGAEKLYGYAAEEVIGRPISIIEPPDRKGEQADILRRVFAGETVHQHETERVRKDGTSILVSLTVSPVRDANYKIVSVAVIGRDVTERKRDEERLRHLADHDQLTGLVNVAASTRSSNASSRGPAATTRTAPSSASISTTLRRSTTPPATRRATRC